MNLNNFQRETENFSRKGRCKPLPNTETIIRPGRREVPLDTGPKYFESDEEYGQHLRSVLLEKLNKKRLNSNFTIKDNSSSCSSSETLTESSPFGDIFKEDEPKRTSERFLRRPWTPLILFRDTAVQPINKFNELPLRSSVIKNLQRLGKFTDLSEVQKWGIPGIRKQLNVAMIGGPKSGKTLAYLLPLMDYIQEPSYFEELPPGNGPHTVVICSNSRTCENIYKFCLKLLGEGAVNCDNPVRVVVVHGGSEKKLRVHLTNGVDLLIATPLCLERLLTYSVIINFERLTCLVMDEIDVLSENPFRHSVRVILEKTKSSEVVQKIFVGEKWSIQVESLVQRYVKNCNLIITSFEDVAIYKKLVPKIIFVEESQKFKHLMEVLKMKSDLGNVVVVCENEKEVTKLKSYFQACFYPVVILCDSYLTEEIEETITSWKSTNPRTLLITTDDILPEYNITDISTIIHFSIPKKSKTNFFLRYAAYCSFNDANKRLTEESDYKLNDIILVDDQNHNQLPHILSFIKEMGGQIPERLESVSKEIWKSHERRKVDKTLCNNLLAFGSCRNRKHCGQRHVFVEKLDTLNWIEMKKWIKFSVLKVQDAACVYVRIEETFDNDQREKVPNHKPEIRERMESFYKVAGNKRSLANIDIGKMCGVELENEETFHRGKIVEFTKFDKFGHPTEIKVRLMDEGDIIIRKTIEVLELPEEVTNFPPGAVEIRLGGIQPLDFDTTWSEISTEFVENIMETPTDANQYWCGEVVVGLQDVLVLDQVMLKRSCVNVGVDVCEMHLQNEIIKELAVKNTKHLPSLRELCLEAGIPLFVQKDREKTNQPIPQWAFFDSKEPKVKLLAAEGLQTVFLQSLKYSELFQELEKELQKEGEKNKKESEKVLSFYVGLYVLAKFEGKWNRGRIEAEEDETLKIFFVDYGDFWLIPKEDVIPIPNTLLTKLPLQAIECRLAGLKLQTESSKKELEKFYDLCNDGYATLTALVAKNDEKTECTGGRKYVVNLINEDGVSINKILISDGFAEEDSSETQYLEDIPQEIEKNEINEEDGFIQLSDELFDDEDGVLFLQEFASKVFNISVPMIKKEENITNECGVNHIVPEIKANEAEKKFSKKKKRSKKGKKDGVDLVLKENIFTPKIIWNQNPQDILIKVDLPDVSDYTLDCSPKNLLFRTFLKEKCYVVDLRLFGIVVPQMTKVTVKTFQVTISLKKLVRLPWPRLHADDEKFWWISWNAEEKEEKDQMTRIIDSVKDDLSSGKLKEGVREKKIVACSDSDFSGTENSYSDSE